jgi:hypothetical protein
LKTNPTTEKEVFNNIATLSKNIEDKINNPKDENEKTKLQELFSKRLGELKNGLDGIVLQNAQNKLDETLKKLKDNLAEQKNSFIQKAEALRLQGLEKRNVPWANSDNTRLRIVWHAKNSKQNAAKRSNKTSETSDKHIRPCLGKEQTLL